MAKSLLLTSFSLKVIILHLSLFGITTQAKPFTFFMHDILGGSTPSERIVSGIIVNSQTNNFPFSKPNNRIFPFKGSIPFADTTSIGSSSTMVVKNIDKNKVVIDKNSLPYVTLEKLLFGRITVIDDEITKGHEFGSEIIGKAQGFHLASSLDGSSKTMAFSALFLNEDHEEEDAISFFGVHRTATNESHIAVVGGTGKYENARGYAKIETVNLSDQNPNYGVETLLQITVYLS